MKKVLLVIVVAAMLGNIGCTRIVRMEPTSGTPGTAVYIKCSGMFGDPAEQCLKWDGKSICHPFPGSFVVPAAENGGDPGKHTVTLIDNVDASEAFLIFPLFRLRHASKTFTVVE